MAISNNKVKEAFRKLQSSIFYENNNLSLRYQLAEFIIEGEESIEVKLNDICSRINNGDAFVSELN